MRSAAWMLMLVVVCGCAADDKPFDWVAYEPHELYILPHQPSEVSSTDVVSGRLLSVTRFTYDSYGRIRSSEVFDALGDPISSAIFAYDDAGPSLRTCDKDFDGDGIVDQRVEWTASFTADGRLARVERFYSYTGGDGSSDVGYRVYEYEGDPWPARYADYAGDEPGSLISVTELRHDADGRLLEERQGGELFRGYQWDYKRRLSVIETPYQRRELEYAPTNQLVLERRLVPEMTGDVSMKYRYE